MYYLYIRIKKKNVTKIKLPRISLYMRKIGILVPALLIMLILAPSALAHSREGQQERIEKHKERISFRIQDLRNRILNSFHYEFNDNDGDNDDGDENENEFEIKGQVESMTGSSFVIGGQTILIDLTKVEHFKQKGTINVGDWVKCEGEVIDGVNYAEEIKVIGEGGGRLSLKVNGISVSVSPTPTSSASPTATPTASPTASPEGTPVESASPSPSVSPSPTSSPVVMVEVKAKGPIDVVTEFLTQVLAYLQGLVT